jgi:hypothetical protein
MLLYTIVPPEVIFEEAVEPEFQNWQKSETRAFEINFNGRNFMLQSLSDGQFKIDRLISTDPRDYLNPDWQPGSIWKIF